MSGTRRKPAQHCFLQAKVRALMGGQNWTYPSRTQCIACHTEVANRSLGPKTTQLNGDFLYPSTMVLANQLTTLDFIGMFSEPLAPPAAHHPALPDIGDGAVPVGIRAKAYMDANCSHCHQPSGPTQASIDLRFEGPLDLCNVPPTQGDLGVPGAMLVTPGSPGTSVLSLRAHLLGLDAMPPLAKSLVDLTGDLRDRQLDQRGKPLRRGSRWATGTQRTTA